MNITDIKIGQALPEMRKTITQEDINLYAKASRDFNPIHIDEEFARKTPLGGTVAHGMLVLAFVSQMMTGAFGRSWLTTGKLNVRFKAAARPGDVITVQGKVKNIQNDNMISCEVQCVNQKGEVVITGEGIVKGEK
jgi:3-hydroxybutyryl-CoA dehydratase